MQQTLKCPSCGSAVEPAALPARSPAATDYLKCLRRCDACGIGFSNTRLNPTVIYRDPLNNVPHEVRDGASDALAAALNETNRSNKRRKFGFSTSEDALTWTVFSYLATQAPGSLLTLGERLFDLRGISEPTVLLWGVPVPYSDRGESLRSRLIEVLRALGESVDCLSEPDVIIDYGDRGVVVVEVKLHAPNDVAAVDSRLKFDRYLRDTAAFASREQTRLSGLYELTRNWRIGCDIAGTRPLRVINLGPPSLFRPSQRLDQFVQSLATSPSAAFQRVSWTELFACIKRECSPLPTWLKAWVRDRVPLATEGAK